MLDLDNQWNAAFFAGPISCRPVHQEGQRFQPDGGPRIGLSGNRACDGLDWSEAFSSRSCTSQLNFSRAVSGALTARIIGRNRRCFSAHGQYSTRS